jgi:hypothetical protein
LSAWDDDIEPVRTIKAHFTHSRSTPDVKFSSSGVIRHLSFSTPKSTRSSHGDGTDNDSFCKDEHSIYLYITGKSPLHVGGIKESTVTAGPYTVDSWTFANVHGRTQVSTNEQDLSWLRRYPWSYRDWPCTVRDQFVYKP